MQYTWYPMQYLQTRTHYTMLGLTVQHLSTSSNYDIIQLATAEVILKYGFLHYNDFCSTKTFGARPLLVSVVMVIFVCYS